MFLCDEVKSEVVEVLEKYGCVGVSERGGQKPERRRSYIPKNLQRKYRAD
jgi:hypothetical protein